MFDQLLDGFRKASESSLQMQQEVVKQWTQQWSKATSAGGNGGGTGPAEMGRPFQKRWHELAIEMLNRHRAAIDETYRSAIEIIEQTFYVADAKSSEEYRRMLEDLWRRVIDRMREQTESQFRDFQKWTERSAGIAQDVKQ